MPEIGYGAVGNTRANLRARIALRYATLPLTFSAWSGKVIRELVGREPEIVYLGVDVDRLRPSASKEDVVVTVGNLTRQNLARKGLETFARATQLLPDTRFVLVGRHADDGVDALRALAPPNLELPGWLPDNELVDLLARAKVYVQVSYAEGFGLALAEGMACGAVPVVTKREPSRRSSVMSATTCRKATPNERHSRSARLSPPVVVLPLASEWSIGSPSHDGGRRFSSCSAGFQGLEMLRARDALGLEEGS